MGELALGQFVLDSCREAGGSIVIRWWCPVSRASPQIGVCLMPTANDCRHGCVGYWRGKHLNDSGLCVAGSRTPDGDIRPFVCLAHSLKVKTGIWGQCTTQKITGLGIEILPHWRFGGTKGSHWKTQKQFLFGTFYIARDEQMVSATDGTIDKYHAYNDLGAWELERPWVSLTGIDALVAQLKGLSLWGQAQAAFEHLTT